jgi:biopolymer transport protein ExbD
LGVNLTPMIDIVFLLIIFFMIVSQISRAIDHPVELPAVGPGGTPLEPVELTINLDRNGQSIVAGEVLHPGEVAAVVRDGLERAGGDPQRLRLLVRCDRRCAGRHVNELIRALESLGIRHIRVAVAEE